jgi:hypothetical protein
MVLLIAGAGALFIDFRSDPEPVASPAQDGGTGEPPAATASAKLGEQVVEMREAVESSLSLLGLEQIIAAGDAAGRAYAAGAPPPTENAALIDRRFEVRIPFGCEGPTPEGVSDPLRWTQDAKQGTFKLSARPETWTDAPFAAGATATPEIEAVEGFWIPRPWLASELCPAASTQSSDLAALPPPRQTLGLAQFFRSGESRLPQRRGRPYEVVKRVGSESVEGAKSFRLLLRGRVVALPDGQPVRCHSEDSDYRPICLISVEYDYVAFENPAAGEILAEWRF